MKTIGQLLKISILVGIIAMGSVGTVQAFNPQPEPPGSVAVGITNVQTARLSVVYPPVHPPDPCRIRLSFFDVEGNLLRVMEDTVEPGQVISLDLRGDELELRGTERLQIYALVEHTGPRKGKGKGCLKAGLELFNNQTGMTTVVLQVAQKMLRKENSR